MQQEFIKQMVCRVFGEEAQPLDALTGAPVREQDSLAYEKYLALKARVYKGLGIAAVAGATLMAVFTGVEVVSNFNSLPDIAAKLPDAYAAMYTVTRGLASFLQANTLFSAMTTYYLGEGAATALSASDEARTELAVETCKRELASAALPQPAQEAAAEQFLSQGMLAEHAAAIEYPAVVYEEGDFSPYTNGYTGQSMLAQQPLPNASDI
ncbi:MAG TPA: hypothetical protein VHC98_01885 [Candidatus Saccharimonadales bacterium]|nr:hypothetical protein [Candidatus Saccharimonadales bacterium]